MVPARVKSFQQNPMAWNVAVTGSVCNINILMHIEYGMVPARVKSFQRNPMACNVAGTRSVCNTNIRMHA